ncbi:acetoacetate--CoA ligase [Actinomycetospora sp. OC33-EN08]|uniref:Acetoacetate--CoA ligase n=1 Tax=Actinomycetospora aurantiaca TaxID=3129233 RepID=A0ABU8MV02_9PSEU
MPDPTPPENCAGTVLREPSDDVLDTTRIGQYVRWLAAERGLSFEDYHQLHSWSVNDPDGFWSSIWDHFAVRGSYDTVLGSRAMPGARWFPGAHLNYAEYLLDGAADLDETAVIAHSQTRDPVELTFAELAAQVARTRVGLQRCGVTRGSRVVAYLPNIPEAVIAFLACASLGAVWAACAPEFGARSVIDRFAQLDPTVLLTVGGYHYGEKSIDKTADVAAIRAGLPTLEHVVAVPYGPHAVPDAITWDAVTAEFAPLTFDAVPFDQPLYVLFSSGTTGLPKAIVHGHGGILLEHLKSHALTMDTRPGDRFLWFTTTAWMMWNVLVSGLLHRAAIVLVDGNPTYPDLLEQWRIAAASRATLLGTSPGYLMACRRAGVHPARDLDLSALRSVGVTGAPLPDSGFDWLAEQFGPDLLVNPMSGGTDVCSGFVGGSPWLPVYRGELSGPGLGVDGAAFDPDGREVVGAPGELVIRQPMPSMPVRFWNDPDDQRYRSTYFDTYPGVWHHGDRVTVTARGSFVISGRSDATLNRGGVRLGTAEFYAVVEELPEVLDSLVVHLEDAEGGPGRLLLFLALTQGTELDDELRTRVRRALREQLSPRHVPDVIDVVPAVPRTLTGKKLEAPIKKILRGHPVADVISADSVQNYAAVSAFTDHAEA